MPPMMRFPHDIVQHVPPNGVMIGQRPVMPMEPHYVQPEAAPMGNCYIFNHLFLKFIADQLLTFLLEGMPVSEQTTTQ
jgi:hypothetical protein